LELTVRDALEFFRIPGVATKLQAHSDVGLDYLTLGQPLSTLSGGECQRIKLASELHKQGTVVAVEQASTHTTVLRKDAAMGQDGHACIASAATSRNSFSVAPLAA
jgi:excinuclease UvrABC ATPase subunit